MSLDNVLEYTGNPNPTVQYDEPAQVFYLHRYRRRSQLRRLGGIATFVAVAASLAFAAPLPAFYFSSLVPHNTRTTSQQLYAITEEQRRRPNQHSSQPWVY